MWDRSHGTLGAICSTRPKQPQGLNLPFVTYTILIGCFSISFLPIRISPFPSTWHLKTEGGLSNTVTTVSGSGTGRQEFQLPLLPTRGWEPTEDGPISSAAERATQNYKFYFRDSQSSLDHSKYGWTQKASHWLKPWSWLRKVKVLAVPETTGFYRCEPLPKASPIFRAFRFAGCLFIILRFCFFGFVFVFLASPNQNIYQGEILQSLLYQEHSTVPTIGDLRLFLWALLTGTLPSSPSAADLSQGALLVLPPIPEGTWLKFLDSSEVHSLSFSRRKAESSRFPFCCGVLGEELRSSSDPASLVPHLH